MAAEAHYDIGGVRDEAARYAECAEEAASMTHAHIYWAQEAQGELDDDREADLYAALVRGIHAAAESVQRSAEDRRYEPDEVARDLRHLADCAEVARALLRYDERENQRHEKTDQHLVRAHRRIDEWPQALASLGNLLRRRRAGTEITLPRPPEHQMPLLEVAR
jgi:hypothetical protein